MSIQRFIWNVAVFLLFLLAMYMTVSSLLNITIMDVRQSFSVQAEGAMPVKPPNLPASSTNLREKTIPFKTTDKTYISSEQIEGPQTLEEAIDFSQYPTTQVVATGYTAGVESTGKTPEHPQYGITYSGVEVRRDLYSTIAADLTVFPLGTILYIPDYGYGIVTDIGGAIKGNKIDLYFDTVEQVYNEWGKQEVDVYVVEKGNGSVSEAEVQALNETEALQVFREQLKQPS